MKIDPRLRYFIKLDNSGNAIPSSIVLRYHKPRVGTWTDITNCVGNCCFSPVYMIICNTNTGGQTITNISYGDVSLDVSLSSGECYTVELPLGSSTVSVTNDGGGSPGRMTATTVTGTGTISPSCQDSENTYVFTVSNAAAGDQYIATLETNTSCTTSTTTTTTTTTP